MVVHKTVDGAETGDGFSYRSGHEVRVRDTTRQIKHLVLV
jgi:hypothetical protein